jgi:hypothetical protein
MENSLCECIGMQLREARGIGGLIWRIDVTGEFVGSERQCMFGRMGGTPVIRGETVGCAGGGGTWGLGSIENENDSSHPSAGPIAVARSNSKRAGLASQA